jgi:hypothetical protein
MDNSDFQTSIYSPTQLANTDRWIFVQDLEGKVFRGSNLPRRLPSNAKYKSEELVT